VTFEELEQRFEAAERERDAYKTLYLEMMERCRKLELGLLGQKSEHLPDTSQLSLDLLAMLLDDRQRAELEAVLARVDAEAEQQEIKAHTRKKPTGRMHIPDALPRVEIELLPPEVQRAGTENFERIGEETIETIERRPASLVVVRIVRPKFVAKERERDAATKVHVAAPVELPIAKGLAGPGMLADTIVKRWQDHQPLHRLESVYGREGLPLSRSTMCGWHAQLAELARPLVSAMRRDAFEQPYLCTDATGVLVQHPEKCRVGHFWVLVAPGRHVLFEYTPQHSSDAVDRVLAGYEGYLVCDAHAVYDHLYVTGNVVEVNCWAHARRYFFKALSSDPQRAKVALNLIGALFRIERTLAEAPRKQKESIRQDKSLPIVNAFFSWCDAEVSHVLDDTPISDGIRYARNQRVGLSRFLTDGRLPIRRVGRWRGDRRSRGVAVTDRFRVRRRCLSPRHGSVSSARSSNRTCGFPASGSPPYSRLRFRPVNAVHMRIEEAECPIEVLVGVLAVPRASPLVLLHQPPAHPSLGISRDRSIWLEHGTLVKVPAPASKDSIDLQDSLFRRVLEPAS
jgi:transposase